MFHVLLTCTQRQRHTQSHTWRNTETLMGIHRDTHRAQLLKPVILLFLRPLNYGTGYVVLDREHKN